MKKSFFIGLLVLLLSISACAPAVTNSKSPAPNVFLRGMEFSSGMRYAATFIKPTAETEMRDVQVEITLPASTTLTGIGIPRQVGMAEVRENGTTRTLAWHIPLVSASQQLDVLSFSVPVKISGPITFFLRWRDATGAEHVEHFDDVPHVTNASETEAELVITQSGYQAMGKSGVMVSAPVTEPPLALSVRVLPVSFNPPAEFGALWWCSLAEMSGIPTGESVDVVVPLRRPITPFTKLALFKQNADGYWSLLPETGTVTADGLSVAYAHPGGLIASGGEEELQPAQVNLDEVTDGTSNTIAFSESPSQPDNVVQAGIADGTSNTIVISESAPVPPPVTDGTSNTVIVAEVALPPTAGAVDGSSNTIIIGEVTSAPALSPTPGAVDGSSNTIIIGEVTSAPALSPTAGVVDGSSNTIIIGEVTSAPALSPTAGAVDGSSNTIIIGEVTSTPALSPTSGAVDGTSNTIIIGEVTLTPTLVLTTSVPEDGPTLTLTPSPTLDVFTSTPETGATAAPPTDIPLTFTPSPTTGAATLAPENEATSTPRPTQVIRIVTATPQPEIPVAASPTRTPAPTLALPVVAFNVPAYMEAGYAGESGVVRVVIIKQEDGLLQCQSGGLICAPLNRTPRP
ncbi:MAG: hypothetical protein L6461_13725 [Anaerolineae bacterium]|nr:hypothetical protein [Anaerolineae bacterium]